MKHPESEHLWCCYISLVCLIQLLLELFLALTSFLLVLQVLLFLVAVVEGIIHVLVIVDPSADHVRVLLMEMHARGLSMKEHWLIVANLVSSQSSRSIEQHLTPQVRVRTRLMHSGIGLEEFLNVELVLLKHSIDFLLICGVQDLLKVSSHTVLLIVESVNVRATDGKHMLSKEFSHHTPIIRVNFQNITCKVLKSFAFR